MKVGNTIFGQDHWERFGSPSGSPDGCFCKPDDQTCLLWDAEYYASLQGPDNEVPELTRSAKRIVKRLTAR